MFGFRGVWKMDGLVGGRWVSDTVRLAWGNLVHDVETGLRGK